MPKTRKGLSTGAKVAIGVGCGVCAAYFAGVAFFSNVFMPNTTLLGRSVSLRPVTEVAKSLGDRTQAYTLSVTGDGFQMTIPGTDVGLHFDAETYAQNAIEETNPWAWPVAVFMSRDINTSRGATFDKEKVSSLVSEAVAAFNATATDPVNATIEYDDEAHGFVVRDEQPGTKLNEEAVQTSVMNALDAFDRTLALGPEDLVAASVTKDDPALAEAAEKANGFLKANVTLDMDGLDAGTIDASQIIQWVTLDDQLNASLDVDAVKQWGLTDLSQRLDTVGSTRTYTRPDGKVVTVSGGTYGWNINSAELATMIQDAVVNGETVTLQVPTYQTAEKVPDENGVDFGSSYIDIDLSEQHARLYRDGNLVWESDVVSGNSSLGHDTPTGVYFIDSYFNKANPASTLIGKIDPETKKPEYESPVACWMPFYGNSIGLHDASWRSSFGGDIYQYNGSHGCVNLPTDKAKELCEQIDQGLVVIVHT